MKREIQIPWSCRMTGDCCRRTKVLLMTREEKQTILSAITPEKAATLTWWDSPEPEGFEYLKLQPCPFLRDDNLCEIHAVRPYNCRRFACYRVGAEPYEATMDNNCQNLLDRIEQSRDVRRDYAVRQRKAQRWARAHGWKDKPEGDQ